MVTRIGFARNYCGNEMEGEELPCAFCDEVFGKVALAHAHLRSEHAVRRSPAANSFHLHLCRKPVASFLTPEITAGFPVPGGPPPH